LGLALFPERLDRESVSPGSGVNIDAARFHRKSCMDHDVLMVLKNRKLLIDSPGRYPP